MRCFQRSNATAITTPTEDGRCNGSKLLVADAGGRASDARTVRFAVAVDHDAAASSELTVGEVVETESLRVKAEEAVSEKATPNNLDYAAKPRRFGLGAASGFDPNLPSGWTPNTTVL